MRLHSIVLKLLLCVLSAALLMVGCARMKEARPIVPVKEYEKLLLGKLTSDYVGNENCLKNCHSHDKLALDFKASTMGDQLKEASSGMKIVDCESCHGPASEMMAALKKLGINNDTEVKAHYDQVVKAHKDNLLDYSKLPSGVLSLICLKCHTSNATFNIHNWNAGIHAVNEVTCANCHPIHGSSDLIVDPRAVQKLCLDCHIDIRAQFSLPSHHPVREGKVFCTDCHEPHGNSNPKLLRGMTVKDICARCHPEKAGPFLFEHSDNTENCAMCHSPHGSVNESLLKLPQVFLCKQCHPTHRVGNDALGGKSMSFTRCTDCHSQIHGSDTPGMSGGGAFTR